MPKIQTLGKSSSIFSNTPSCAYCHTRFALGDKVVLCPKCQTAHHASCWQAYGNKCAKHLCTGNGPIYQPTVLFSRISMKWGTLFIVLTMLALLYGIVSFSNKSQRQKISSPPAEVISTITLPAMPITSTLLLTSVPTLDAYGELTLVRVENPGRSSERRAVCRIDSNSAFLSEFELECILNLPSGKTTHIDWNDDGSQLIYTTQSSTSESYQSFILDIASGKEMRPTLPFQNIQRPRWRPGHTDQIAFEVINNQHVEIHVVSTVDTNDHITIAIAGNNVWPSWSLDGRYLLFSNDFQSSYQVYQTDDIDRQSELRHLVDVVAISQGNAACRGAVMGEDTTIAYICQYKGRYFIQITDPQHQQTDIEVPLDLRPRGYLVWLPNGVGYVFECESVATPQNIKRSDICFANALDKTVVILPLPQESYYIAPAWRASTLK